ncbi:MULTISPECIES: hypothetical protein [Vibrio]|uniref:Uncharacterized protein n=1 Tax=Vibrio diazotrophicus TaxID=685 RepID=A0A2J8HCP2_VIBDI|nr:MULTISPECIES: hypothetical protein [Vibrio]MCF7363698.1 hypothetical protein [Vibrio sp. A1-b2]MCZ4372364.1 hypothetical protein [Vibrio diazotrophicus]PNH96046.1 hypothetical protein C1O24_12405 [Vibrio diazotrophicus]PNH98364.1 hypothetical protein C1O25_19150 [Vibrio diazotrophicus]PNI01367.1 hypothetical protein C1N32_20520 [Vibrio diazotrophicus]
MNIRESIDALEQQIYIACSEGDYETVNMLEAQLEKLRGKAEHPFDEDPYALEGRAFLDDDDWS